MIKMFYALLLGVFLMLSLDVSAGPLSIISTEIERDASYARIATNAEYVIFFLQNLLPPSPHQECSLGARTIEWKVSPETSAGHSDTSQEMFQVNFANPGDFGVSYKISVSVSWSMIDNQTGLYAEPVVKTATYTLDAIMYSFTVACSDGTACLDGGSSLVDNHPAVAKVVPQGCTRRELLRMKLTSTPQEKNPVNKAGTSMLFSVLSTDTCTFTTPKTYWYGLAHPKDCFFLQYYYIIELECDLVIVARKKETVGWPDAEPQLLFQERIPEYTRNVLELPNGRYRMTISNIEITLDTQIQSSTSQYQREAQTEEEYHERQLKGLVSISDGGCGDLFDVENAMRSAGFVKTSNGYIRDSAPGQSRALFEFTVLYDVRQALASEIDESRQLIDLNRGNMEKCAKEAAGYNAAFRYHCTYGHRLSGCLFLGEEDTLTARTPR